MNKKQKKLLIRVLAAGAMLLDLQEFADSGRNRECIRRRCPFFAPTGS